jgi:hypothetical protein
MTRRQAKKRPKRPASKRQKVTGLVTNLTAKQIRLLSNKRHIWEINRTPKPKVISGTLRRGSTVTVEFNKKDGKKLGGPQPGKRTETGTVIGLTASQIKLQTSADGTWIISLTDDNTIVTGTLALGSTVRVQFNEPPGHQVVA